MSKILVLVAAAVVGVLSLVSFGWSDTSHRVTASDFGNGCGRYQFDLRHFDQKGEPDECVIFCFDTVSGRSWVIRQGYELEPGVWQQLGTSPTPAHPGGDLASCDRYQFRVLTFDFPGTLNVPLAYRLDTATGQAWVIRLKPQRSRGVWEEIGAVVE